MVCAFMPDWFAETSRWVDASIKTAAAESPQNAQLLADWTSAWLLRATDALEPVATLALGEGAGPVFETVVDAFKARAGKLGLPL